MTKCCGSKGKLIKCADCAKEICKCLEPVCTPCFFNKMNIQNPVYRNLERSHE